MNGLHTFFAICFFLLLNPFINSVGQQNPIEDSKARLIILADMGNEPDEEQQMIHMLICSNEFELEGLIAVTGKYLREKPRPDLFIKLIDGYEKVLSNLKLHATGWHEADYLRNITVSGQQNYGMDDVGEGKSSGGSELIYHAMNKTDARPLWIVVNAGSNTLAQALYDFSMRHTEDELNKALKKLRVFENGAQDNAGAWICHSFPGIHWIRSNFQTYAYGGPGGDADGEVDQDLGPYYWPPFDFSARGQNEWLKHHAMKNHGALGALYPERFWDQWGYGFMEGGGTIPWIGLVNRGLFDIDHASWGGWGGRFTSQMVSNVWSRHADVRIDEQQYAPFYTYSEASDVWTDPMSGIVYENDFVPVWRWRESMYHDFLCRMDWCVKSFADANHHPVAGFNGDLSNNIIYMATLTGDSLLLDASTSYDPDKDDIEFKWWCYNEAGTYCGKIIIANNDQKKTFIKVPLDAEGKQIHIILEIKDDNSIAPLFDFRRIVINVGN